MGADNASPMDVLKVIQMLVAPVVIISANGLICLALYNRLAAIVTRARTFTKERFDSVTRLSALPLEHQNGIEARRLRQRIDALDDQVRHILSRARIVRNALLLLLTTVVSMLICSIFLGMSILVDWLALTSLAVFVAGLLVMIAGVVLAMVELARALEPVTLEVAAHTDDPMPASETI